MTREYYAEGELVPGTPPQTLYYGPDQIGSVRRVFASLSSAPAYSYDPYGVPLQATTPLTDFTYAGMFHDADSGLDLTRYRAYDPIAGRWLSRDPLGEVSDPVGNLYLYVGGNPISIIDPLGLFFWSDLLQFVRLPDYWAINLNAAIPDPWTGTIIGWSGTISLDRYGDWYYSPSGVGLGKSATVISASATAKSRFRNS